MESTKSITIVIKYFSRFSLCMYLDLKSMTHNAIVKTVIQNVFVCVVI